MSLKRELELELETIRRMLELYCRDKHGGDGLCAECGALLEYARLRLHKCPQNPKPKCSDCKIHCYAIDQRNQIKAVMRYAGPKMLLRHPVLTLRHLCK